MYVFYIHLFLGLVQDCSNVSRRIIHLEVLQTTTNFTIKDKITLVFKAKNCSTNCTNTIKDYICRTITFVEQRYQTTP